MMETRASETMRRENLRRTLSPRSIAVVGATNALEKAGAQAMVALERFPGKVYPINPKADEVMGRKCHASLRDLPEAPDLVILAAPGQAAPAVAEEAAQTGAGGLLVISGGFAEAGPEGALLQDALVATCRSSGMRLLGPNTSGYVAPANGCIASFAPGLDVLAAGPVGVVAQSGGINLSITLLLHAMGVGVSCAIGLGNAADVTSIDAIDFLIDDPQTRCIALHLEGVADGRRLYEVVARAVQKKPVVVFPVGKEDVGEFAQSHTGNLMGKHSTTVAAMRQAGAVVVDGCEALALAAAVLSCRRLPPLSRPGIAVITGQAGPGLVIADKLKTAKVEVPALNPATLERLGELLPPLTFIQNPVDTGRPAPTFGEVVQTILADDRVDAAAIFALDEPSSLDAEAVLQSAAKSTDKPIMFASMGTRDLAGLRWTLAAEGVFATDSPDALAAAVVALVRDSETRSRSDACAAHSIPYARPSRASLPDLPDEAKAKELLSIYGIRTPKRRVCDTREAAREALGALSGPVAVKVLDAAILHKSDVGGVHLGVHDEAGMERALDAIDRIHGSSARRYLVEEMTRFDTELLLGGINEPSWGPCITVGLGGVFTEVMGDAATRISPLTPADARDMLLSLKGAVLLGGHRGKPAANIDAIVDAIMAVQSIMKDFPQIREIEVNPLVIHKEEVTALDALISTAN